jgi:hypothetical protein
MLVCKVVKTKPDRTGWSDREPVMYPVRLGLKTGRRRTGPEPEKTGEPAGPNDSMVPFYYFKRRSK